MRISTYQLLKGVAKSTLPQTNYGKCALGLSASFYGYTFRKLPFEKALASTFFCSLITSFAIRFIEQKYHFSKKPPSPPLSGPPKPKPSKFTQSKPKQEDISSIIENTPAIARDFTEVNSIEQIREHHEKAKSFLETYLPQVNAEVYFASSSIHHAPKSADITIDASQLSSCVFYWENSLEVRESILADAATNGLAKDTIVMYEVDGLYNATQAYSARSMYSPGTAYENWGLFSLQGNSVQVQFPNEQAELINCAAHLGFNGFANTLSDSTKGAIQNGFLIPQSQEQLKELLHQLKEQPSNLEFLCIKNTPKNATHPIYQFLTSAPAFKRYSPILSDSEDEDRSDLNKQDKQELQFLCALQSYEAQFETAIALAQKTRKPVILKLTPLGVERFENPSEMIAKAFYQAAIEYQRNMENSKVKVYLQVHKGLSREKTIANCLGLAEITSD